MKAAVGQIWASNDSRDRAHGWRQERLVTAIDDGCAFLQTRRDGMPIGTGGSYGVALAPDGSIKRHRYIHAGLDPQRQQEAAQRADNLEREAEEAERQAFALRAQADAIRASWNLPAGS